MQFYPHNFEPHKVYEAEGGSAMIQMVLFINLSFFFFLDLAMGGIP